MLRVAVVAGEVSGDSLGAQLITVMKAHCDFIQFEGIAGPQMVAAGCHAIYDIDRLAVMGLTEVLPRLLELIKIRRSLYQYFKANPPDVFIGIDAPDFNLPLARQLKKIGIKTIHYVSPSVWAWRQNRLKSIAKSIDLMLTLFPFEAKFYQQYRVPVQYVGHPLAASIPFFSDQISAQQSLQLAYPSADKWVALLPGSRMSEVKRLSGLMLETAERCVQAYPQVQFLVPLVNESIYHYFAKQVQQYSVELPIQLIRGDSREVMAASDVVLLASGTATLEAMLLKRPMVVVYRMAPLSYWLIKRMIKVDCIALPNLLAGEKLVPECIQHQACPDILTQHILHYLRDATQVEQLQARFLQIHKSLQTHEEHSAGMSVLHFLDKQLA